MPDQFQTLLAAILNDDHARAKELLAQNAVLATACATKPRLEPRIGHWIYGGDSALHIAAAGHQVEVAKLLLEAGADCGAVGKHRQSQPLHYAADGSPDNPKRDAQRQVWMIELLLRAGADIHARDKNGATPLHRAVRTRCASAVKSLLNAGADARLRNKPGSTPFHLAVQNTGRGGSGSEQAKPAQREIIQAFLERGVSPTIEDAKGKSVLDWAKSDWIRELLSRNGDSKSGRAGNEKRYGRKP